MKIPTTFFVHPGYLRRQDLDQKLIGSCRDNAGYGSYETYLNNLQRLYLEISPPRVFLAQLQRGQLHRYMKGFNPEKKDIVIEFEGRPDLVSFTVLKPKKQRWERDVHLHKREFLSFLRAQGIEEILLAGEMGPYELSKEGCVGALYFMLKDHLQVRGVKDCIFPLIPYQKRITPEFKREYIRKIGRKDTKMFREQERMFRDLYGRAVNIFYKD